jgi:hypothetical protein
LHFIIFTVLSIQPVIRLYGVPLAAFTGEDEDGEGSEDEQE